MKTITTIILILSTSLIFSQNINSNPNTGLQSIVNGSFGAGNVVGTFINEKPKEIAGEIHLFENWINISEINIDDKIYKIFNINFNMKTNNFESKVGTDSLYVFDISNINHIHINSRKFKSYFFDKENKNQSFEIVYDGDDMKLMKGYEIGIKFGTPDPTMVKETQDKYFTTTTYYIKEGNDIKEISLKKKKILVLFKDKSAVVSSYVKKNKLSYKKDRDLNRIFTYFDSL